MRGPMSAWSSDSKGIRVHDLRHHAATVIARNPDVTLRELMATIGHSSHVAALALPTLHRRAKPGHRRLPRRRHHGRPERPRCADSRRRPKITRGMGVAWRRPTSRWIAIE